MILLDKFGAFLIHGLGALYSPMVLLTAVCGNAAAPEMLRASNLGEARWCFVAVPNAFEAGQVIEQARAINPHLPIIARAHSDAEVDHLQGLGASVTIMGEQEIARAMIEHVA